MLRGAAGSALGVLLLLASAAAPAQGPALDYLQHCAGCHMNDGAGSVRNGVPDMRGSVGHFARLPAGRAFLVQVAGVAQAPLPDERLAALLNWLLRQFSAAELPPDFEPYSAAEVGTLRATRPADLPTLRAELAAELTSRGHAVTPY